MQEKLEEAGEEKWGTAVISGNSGYYYVDSKDPECAGADLVVGDAPDGVYVPAVYEAICTSPGKCQFDESKPLGSVCMSDEDTMASVRSTLGVKVKEEVQTPPATTAKENPAPASSAANTEVKGQLVERDKESARAVAGNVFNSLQQNAGFLGLSKEGQGKVISFLVKEAKRGVDEGKILSDARSMVDSIAEGETVEELKGVKEGHDSEINSPSTPENFHKKQRDKLDNLD